MSAIIFIISLLTYQSSRIFVPMLVLTLILLFKDEFGFKKMFSFFAIFFTFFTILISIVFLTGQSDRLSTLNFFAYTRLQNEINLIRNEDHQIIDQLGFQFLHGEWWAYTRGLIERYLNYFSPKMLVLEGDYNQRHKIPDIGVMFYFSFILLPFGLLYFLKKNNVGSKLLLIWLLLAPIPAVLSRDLINLLRSLNSVFPLEVLQATGLVFLIQRFKSNKILLKSFLIVLILVFIDRYFIHAPKEYSSYWLYGYKQAVEIVKTKSENYQKIIITDFYGQPYIYYLFYTKYPPQTYQKQARLNQKNTDVGKVEKIDNIEFRPIFWPKERGDKNHLFIGTLEELPDQDIKPFEEYNLIKDINFLNDQHALRIVEIK